MKDIERRLAVVLKKERRDAICYALLTLLCAPFFVVLISLLVSLGVMLTVGLVFRVSRFAMDARAFYGCLILFLAITAALVHSKSRSGDEPYRLDLTWLAGVVVLLVLVYLTFATPLFRTRRRTLAAIHAAAGFLALALFGRSYMKTPFARDVDFDDSYWSLPLALVGFVAMACGEIASSSWLWFPPGEDDVRVAAWILHKLTVDHDGRLDVQSTNRRILELLFRLKYVQIRNGKLRLTYKGYDLVKSAGRKDAVE
jgi:hypothetical protein